MPEQKPSWVNKTQRAFTGQVASGREVVVNAEDDTYTITAPRELPQAKIDLAVKEGFNDKSVEGLTILEAEKRNVGDINKVARGVIEPDELWTSKATQGQGRGR